MLKCQMESLILSKKKTKAFQRARTVELNELGRDRWRSLVSAFETRDQLTDDRRSKYHALTIFEDVSRK